MRVRVIEHSPSDYLRPFVSWYWEGDFNIGATGQLNQQVVPNGYVELIIHLSDGHCDLLGRQGWGPSPDYTIIGLYTRPYEVQFPTHVSVFGIRFKPEGIFNIFGVPAAAFKGEFEDMVMVLGNEFRSFCESLKESVTTTDKIMLTNHYLTQMAERNKIEMNYVNQAAELIRQAKGNLRIEELPQQVHISLRQLERTFKNQIGITPKHYLRIARMNEVHRLLQEKSCLNFTEVAHQSGYADQAHFIRDFKQITGAKPTVFLHNNQQFLIDATPGGIKQRNAPYTATAPLPIR